MEEAAEAAEEVEIIIEEIIMVMEDIIIIDQILQWEVMIAIRIIMEIIIDQEIMNTKDYYLIFVTLLIFLKELRILFCKYWVKLNNIFSRYISYI